MFLKLAKWITGKKEFKFEKQRNKLLSKRHFFLLERKEFLANKKQTEHLHRIKESALNVMESRLTMKEQKLNNLIVTKEEQIDKARKAEIAFDEHRLNFNIYHNSKLIGHRNNIKKLSRK